MVSYGAIDEHRGRKDMKFPDMCPYCGHGYKLDGYTEEDSEVEPIGVSFEQPYNCTWDQRIFGMHKIIVKAYDSIDQIATDEIDVFILNFDLR